MSLLSQNNSSFVVATKFDTNEHDRPPSFSAAVDPLNKRSLEKNSSFVDRIPSSFGSYKTSGSESSMDVPMLSPVDVTRKSYPNKKHFMLQPLFTMKRLDRYLRTPNEELLAHVAKSHYEEDNLDDIINQDLRKQMDQESLKIFSETAYHCLNEKRAQRPNIDQILRNLEKALNLQKKRDNPEDPKVAGEVDVTTSNRLKVSNYF
ncbi:hypothetical protein E3N88_14363 [Mikania micrantha]|uniref:Protein kinase domain-containing protein n=1 Tax=Mikania micrantha TaxID=192012 RepID=A0A5N6P379_9ASTR|nr:hypothetical protein E3N88_14363 [Mikania micrantha]